jgi:hypothetical protein
LTLPQWAREHNLVTNVFYAMEYHQCRLDIRDKELALNFAVSFLRPIDTKLMNCVKEVAAAKKIRLNAEIGKQMLNDMRFWLQDIHELGELSEDESPNANREQQSLMDTLTSGIDDDETDSKRSMAERMLMTF